MAGSRRELTFDIFGRDRTASRAIGQVNRSVGSLQKGIGRLAVGLAGVLSVRQIGRWAKTSVKDYASAEAAQARLTDAYERFPQAGNLQIGVLRDLTSAIQRKTRVDDDQLQAAQATLFNTGLQATQVRELTPLLADYAVKMKTDVGPAADIFNKAILGQGRGLKTLGVNFVDTGSKAGNYAQLIDILREKVGGFAEKEGQKLEGQLERIKLQQGELSEQTGKLFAPSVGHLADMFGEKLIPVVSTLVDKYGPRVTAFLDSGVAKVGRFLDAIKSASDSGSLKPLQDLFSASPGVSAFFGMIDKLAPLLPVIGDGLLKVGTALIDSGALDALTTLVVTVLPPLVQLLAAVTPLIGPLASVIGTVLVPVLQALNYDISGTTALLSGNIGQMKSWLKEVLNLPGPLGDMVRFMTTLSLGMLNSIGKAINGVSGAIEALINSFTSLTGVTVKLHRIPNVTIENLTGSNYKPSGANAQNVPGSTAGRYADGGFFGMRPGGWYGQIAEGKHDEVALPLSDKVYRRMGAGIAAATGGGGGMQVNLTVHGSVFERNQLVQQLSQEFRKAVKSGSVPVTAFSST